jgi:hypothetical protein
MWIDLNFLAFIHEFCLPLCSRILPDLDGRDDLHTIPTLSELVEAIVARSCTALPQTIKVALIPIFEVVRMPVSYDL